MYFTAIFGVRILRRIFGLKRDGNESGDDFITRNFKLRLAGHVTGMKAGSLAFKILTGRCTINRLLGRSWRRWREYYKDLECQYEELN